MGLNFGAMAALGMLGPIVGALVHNLGSVVVVLNSALLLKVKDNTVFNEVA
jgi:P-type Cu+ transporter